jgi:hypothetical protein
MQSSLWVPPQRALRGCFMLRCTIDHLGAVGLAVKPFYIAPQQKNYDAAPFTDR